MKSRPTEIYAPEEARTGHFRNPNFSEATTATLRAWLEANRRKPYPTKRQKRSLIRKTGLTLKQLDIWFTNARSVSKSYLTVVSRYFTEDSQVQKTPPDRRDRER